VTKLCDFQFILFIRERESSLKRFGRELRANIYGDCLQRLSLVKKEEGCSVILLSYDEHCSF
jgi:hypothetical protein